MSAVSPQGLSPDPVPEARRVVIARIIELVVELSLIGTVPPSNARMFALRGLAQSLAQLHAEEPSGQLLRHLAEVSTETAVADATPRAHALARELLSLATNDAMIRGVLRSLLGTPEVARSLDAIKRVIDFINRFAAQGAWDFRALDEFARDEEREYGGGSGVAARAVAFLQSAVTYRRQRG